MSRKQKKQNKAPKEKKPTLSQAQELVENLGLVHNENPDNWSKRILIFTPTRGLLRIEWVQGRYNQTIPTNWSHVELIQYLNAYMPVSYQLADAQNLMAKVVVEGDYDWVFYVEDDNILPNNCLMIMNQYMNKGDIPVISGIYFTKSDPSEPIIYRGRGNSYYQDWKMGDKVWCDGIPFGCRLEHAGLIKEAWKNSPEYKVGGMTTRRVFDQPNSSWFDPVKGGFAALGGTTDLAWCSRIIKEDLLTKAGFPEIAKKEFPFLCDTGIFVKHITQDGVIFPDRESLKPFLPDEKTKKKKGKT